MVLAIGLMIIAYKLTIRWLLFLPMLFWFIIALWAMVSPIHNVNMDIGADGLTIRDFPFEYVVWIMRLVAPIMAIATAFLAIGFNTRRENPDKLQDSFNQQEDAQIGGLTKAFNGNVKRFNKDYKNSVQERRKRGEWVDDENYGD